MRIYFNVKEKKTLKKRNLKKRVKTKSTGEVK